MTTGAGQDDRAGPRPGTEWTVTLWTEDGAQAAHITGIDGRDAALLTAARALVGEDVYLARCARARVEGWDRRRRRAVSWWLGEAPHRPPAPSPALPPMPPLPEQAKPRGRWPWSR